MMRLTALLLIVLCLAGCGGGSDDATELTLYTSVDEPTARAVVERFEEQSGISVRLVTDTEANKSVGLAERLRAEVNRPVADVFWGNEPFHTVRLADEGVLATYEPTTAGDVLPIYRDVENRWIGNGLRARVAAMDAAEAPTTLSLTELVDPTWRDQVVLARPTAGTTSGHVAALYVLWGQEQADVYFRDLHANGARLVSGNGPSAREVAEGGAAIGLTDNDDVANVNAGSEQLAAVLPDQGEGQIGTLPIPTTVALVNKAEPSDAAKQLVDFLASPEVEAMLLEANFTMASVRTPPEAGGIRAMEVDYAEVAEVMPEAVQRATALLEGREP